MGDDRRVPGLVRRVAYRPGESAAFCLDPGCPGYLTQNAGYRAAGKAARTHTEQTGHETVARHVQTVSYRPT